MKITEEEFEENRRESRKFYINQTLLVNTIKFIAGIALMTLILYGLRYGG